MLVINDIAEILAFPVQTVAAPDLGIDRVVFYKIDMKTAQLTAKQEQPYLILPPGSGPRHLAFSADGHFVYVTNELTSTVCVFEMKGKNPPLIQEVSTLPEGTDKSKNSTAEIETSADGKFLYVSNRGDDSIAVFSADPIGGKLALIQNVPSGGKHPRFFCLAPSGKFLISCNMETNNVAVFAVDPESGKLTQTATNISVSKPVCAVFVP
ncbi:hypothetical protein FACS1894189_7770 [Planctomycetales bacterium]|nr:hypothetical protein FACS1894189_7770 [Planctomycetales bacterium]